MEKKSNTSSNILIVDDEIGPRESLRMILKTNYNIRCVDNGNAAIQMVQRNQVDIVTLDLKMPGLSGVDTLKQIRAIDPDVIVIIITGDGTLRSAIEAIRYGAFDYISKPFSVPEIMSIIERGIQRRRLNVKIRQLVSDGLDQQMVQKEDSQSHFFPERGLYAIRESEKEWRAGLFS